MKAILEVNKKCVDRTDKFSIKTAFGETPVLMISPTTGDDYWMFRVKLCKDQAVVGFPKFGMIGVGMALEENGNTNLPLCAIYTPEKNAKRITKHIKCNKKYKSITIKMIEDAIILIEKGAAEYCNKGERAYNV